MKLDVFKLKHNIQELPEKERYDSNDLSMILGLVSGNKICYKRASLDDIAYYIDNLEEILDLEYNSDIPTINLSTINGSRIFRRRAI